VEVIDAEFVHHEKEDHETNGDAGCQAEDVDEGEYLILCQVFPGNFQVVLEHRRDSLSVRWLASQLSYEKGAG